MQTSQNNNLPSLQDNSFLLCLPLWILLSLLISSCSVKEPKLNRPFLPLGYQLDTAVWTKIVETPQSIYLLPLNYRAQLNRRVLSSWKNGLLNEAFIRAQPLSTIHREDIINLATFLNQFFAFYLVAIDSKEPVSQKQLQSVMRNHLKCDPLTNLEIRFLMNAGSWTPFSRKPLTMLLITGHELSLLSGAQPVYPQVFSPYLRDKLKLPSLNQPENFNLFAAKNKNRVYSTPTNGFIICDKRYPNNSLKK